MQKIKRSTVLLLVLVVSYLSALAFSMVYTVDCHSKYQWRDDKVAEIIKNAPNIRVVVLTDSSQLKSLFFKNFDASNKSNPYRIVSFGDSTLISAFCRACTIRKDTMFLDNTLRFAAKDSNNHIYFAFPLLKKTYLNDELIKDYEIFEN